MTDRPRTPFPFRLVAPLALLGVLAACTEELPETAPVQLPGAAFHYPEELWDAGVEGETVLRLFVTEEGAVDTVRVERESGYAAFDSSAIDGARELRFEPARRGDAPVSVWVLLPVQFELPQPDTAQP